MPQMLARCKRYRNATRDLESEHVLGILGLIVSGGLAILTSPTPLGVLAASVTSQAMSDFPLSLVPTFLGPVVLILHLTALTIARDRRQVARMLPDLFAQRFRNA